MVQKWPVLDEHQYYVRDRYGVIWFADTQFGNGVVTAVTSQGSISAALSVLRDLRGPLHLLEFLNQNNGILDKVPIIEPQPNLHKAQQDVIAVTEADMKKLTGG